MMYSFALRKDIKSYKTENNNNKLIINVKAY